MPQTLFGKGMYCLFSVLLSFGSSFLLLVTLFCLHREKKSHFLIRYLSLSLLCLGIIILFSFSLFSRVFPMEGAFIDWVDEVNRDYRILTVILIISLVVFIAAFSFRLTAKDLLFIAPVSYLIQSIRINLFAIIAPYIPSYSFLVNAAITLVVYLFSYFAFIRKNNREEIEIGIPALILLCSSSVIIIFLMEYLLTFSAQMAAQIYGVFASLVMLFLMFGTFQKSKERSEKEKLRYMLEFEQNHYEKMNTAIESINVRYHDIRKYITQLENVSDDQEKRKLIQDMQGELDSWSALIKTGNKALDSIIAEKTILCREKGIQLFCMVDSKALEKMEIQDIYSLFGNALDNAITAVSGLEDPEKRVIFMKVHIQDSFLSIHFENGFAGKLKYDSNAQIMTTKEDREIHGYGLKSIQRVVGKYNGEVSISAEDHRFVLNLIFPLENGVIADPIDL